MLRRRVACEMKDCLIPAIINFVKLDLKCYTMRVTGCLLVALLFSLEAFSQQKHSLNGQTYYLEGKIAPNIPAFLWFTIRDSTAVGEVKYTKSKSRKSIK